LNELLSEAIHYNLLVDPLLQITRHELHVVPPTR